MYILSELYVALGKDRDVNRAADLNILVDINAEDLAAIRQYRQLAMAVNAVEHRLISFYRSALSPHYLLALGEAGAVLSAGETVRVYDTNPIERVIVPRTFPYHMRFYERDVAFYVTSIVRGSTAQCRSARIDYEFLGIG